MPIIVTHNGNSLSATAVFLKSTPTDGNHATTKAYVDGLIATGTTKAYVDTSISNLVNGAGPALDTLKELATALNNDATFSTTVTNLIAAKAPIASPTFTGTVAGITAAMVGLGSVTNTSDANKPVSTAQQTALDAKAPIASPTFTGTVTLPSTAITNNLQAVTKAYVDSIAGAQVTVSDTAPTSPAAGAIWFNSSNGITSIYYDSTWVDVGGGDSVNNVNLLDFTSNQSLGVLKMAGGSPIGNGTSGYQKLPGNLIIQWGNIANAPSGLSTFPIAFPTQCFVVIMSNTDFQGSNVDNAYGYVYSNSQFYSSTKSSANNGNSDYPRCFIALGF